MQVMGIEVEVQKHVCDVFFKNFENSKLIESTDYFLFEAIDRNYDAIIQIKKSYPKEIIIFEKKYKSCKRAETEYEKKIKKYCSLSSISEYCLKYDRMEKMDEMFGNEVEIVLLD